MTKFYFTLNIFVLLMISIVYKLWNFSLGVPFNYAGDALIEQSIIKNLIEGGGYYTNLNLGAPFGSQFYDFPIGDLFNAIIIKILGWLLAGDWANVRNTFVVLSYLLAATSASWALLRLNISRSLSWVGGVLFALTPFHFYRATEHLVLASCFIVPILVWISLFLAQRGENNEDDKIKPIHTWGMIFCAIMAGSSFIYFGFFGIIIIIIGSLIGLANSRKLSSLKTSAILCTVILAVELLIMIPAINYKLEFGPNTVAASRSPVESDFYGLRLSQMMFPIKEHRISQLGEFRKNYDLNTPSVNENSYATLGLVGSIGVLGFLLLLIFRKKFHFISPNLENATAIFWSLFVIGTIGGIGSIVAWIGFDQIRAYNRISIFLCFLAIYCFMFILGRALFHLPKTKLGEISKYLLITLVLAVGILDQTSSAFVPPYTTVNKEFNSDKDFVNRIENILPKGSNILQLPFIEFPEKLPLFKEGFYGHLRGYLHSSSLNWSYGSMKGREPAAWIKQISNLETSNMINAAIQAGYSGIYIDRRAFSDNAIAFEAELLKFISFVPIVSRDGNLVFYRLPIFSEIKNQVKIFPILSSGFYGWEGVDGSFSWARNNAQISIFHPIPTKSRCLIDFKLGALDSRSVKVWSYGNEPINIKILNAWEEYPVTISDITINGIFRINLTTTTSPVYAQGDPRALSFFIKNVNFSCNEYS